MTQRGESCWPCPPWRGSLARGKGLEEEVRAEGGGQGRGGKGREGEVRAGGGGQGRGGKGRDREGEVRVEGGQ